MIKSQGARAATRIRAASDRILLLAHRWECDEIVAESFFIPPRSRAGKAVETLWLHGVVCTDLVLSGLPPPLYVPGSTLRKWITDNGRAEKADMRRCVKDTYGIDIAEDNECDAFALTQLCIAYNEWRTGNFAHLGPYEREAVAKWSRAFEINDADG